VLNFSGVENVPASTGQTGQSAIAKKPQKWVSFGVATNNKEQQLKQSSHTVKSSTVSSKGMKQEVVESASF
jgi:hypothetical protein